MTFVKGQEGGPGKPPEYNEETAEFYNQKCYEMALAGRTNKEMAHRLGHSVSTINRWLKQHPSFWDAVTRGRDEADDKVAASLFKRAVGYEYDAEKIVTVNTGPGFSAVERVPITTVVLPDVGAQMNWLKNRNPDKWRDKQEDKNLSGTVRVTLNLEDEPKPDDEDNEEK